MLKSVPHMLDVAANLSQGLDVQRVCVQITLGDGVVRRSGSCMCSPNLRPDVLAAPRPRRDAFTSPRGSNGKRSCLNTNLEYAFWFFSLPPADKESCSLLVEATLPLSQEQRCKAQPCKATPPLSGSWAIFYIYQLSKETAGLAVCWQRQSTPFLYSTSPWMFTGTKHKRRSPVICLQSDFKDL